MRIKTTFYNFLIFGLGALTAFAFSYFSGPSSPSECILKYVKANMQRDAANAVIDACNTKSYATFQSRIFNAPSSMPRSHDATGAAPQVGGLPTLRAAPSKPIREVPPTTGADAPNKCESDSDGNCWCDQPQTSDGRCPATEAVKTKP
jgi:hypothetical protein